MKRLREHDPRTPLLDEAARLLDAVEPLADSPARALRIRRALERERGVLARLRRLPSLAVAMLCLLFGASAFGAYRLVAAWVAPTLPAAHPAQARSAETLRASAPAKPAATPAQRTPAVQSKPEREAAVAAATHVIAPAAEPSASASAKSGVKLTPLVPVRAPARTISSARGTLRASSPHEPTQAETPAPAPAAREAAAAAAAVAAAPAAGANDRVVSDSELVHRAAVALRRDRDPALAARLLDQYRTQYPEGPLAEESLALRIEAATALHELRRVTFARAYLARYPEGHYRGVAMAALEGATP